MAGNRIKGITVEIGGDTTKLQTALKGVNTEIRNTQSQLTDVANTIRAHLHFSVPDEGPLTDFESWMPDFMSGLAEGIEKSRGMVKAAVNSVAADMVVSPQMAVVRHGVVSIPVSFSVTAKWLKKLAGYAKKDKISVQYFDVEMAELKLAEMYVTEYKAKLKKDTSYKGLWTVSFTLKEM